MISVVIPLYNKEDVIDQSLRSVLTQDCDDFEIVVVNDGSTDKSVEIVKSISDTRVALIEQENGGPSKARNTGVKNANGEWVLFLDADDELQHGALNSFNHAINAYSDADFIISPFYINNGEKQFLKNLDKSGVICNPFKELYLNKFVIVPGSFVCKKNLLQMHPFNEQLRRYEDFDLWFRLLNIAKIYRLLNPAVVINTNFAEASKCRDDISEDFVGHLNFKGKSFWEFMCLYKLYLWERTYYKGQIEKLYPFLKYRYDLLLLHKILNTMSPYL